jgi:chromate transporter
MMNSPSATVALALHLALLSSISFGGFPSVLPDVHNFVTANSWATDQEFANFFAVSQVMPGPNMILMMSFIGLKVGGIPGAIAAALATFGPPCVMYFTAYRLWDHFRDMPWQRIVRRGLAPLTIGLVIAGGYVMARAGDVGWQSVALTLAAVGLMGRNTTQSTLDPRRRWGTGRPRPPLERGSGLNRLKIACMPRGRGYPPRC